MVANGPRRGAGRWLIAALLAAAGVGMTSNVLGNVLADRAPSAALRVAPDNARALSAVAARLAVPDSDAATRTEALALAVRAHRRDPTNQRALRSIGFLAELRGDTRAARALVTRATRISARDLEAQLWLIEDSVRRDDVPGALTHHDIALRVSKRAPALLFPVLIAATEDRELLPPLLRVLARNPTWGGFFMLNAAGGASRPEHVAWLAERLIERRVPVSGEAVRTLIGRLAGDRRYAAAWRLYAMANPQQRGTLVRDAAFALSASDGTPFDWSFSQDAAVANPDSDGDQGFLSFSAPVGAGGVVARQMTLLQPGRYRFAARILASTAPNENAPTWRILCAGDNEQLARLPILRVDERARDITTEFDMPAGCEAAIIELALAAVDVPGGQEGRVAAVSLTPSTRAMP